MPSNPLLTYKFQIYFADEGDAPLLGMTSMTTIDRQIPNVDLRTVDKTLGPALDIQGGTAQKAVTFERGLGLCDGRLENWASGAKSRLPAGRPQDDPRDLQVDVMTTDGKIGLSYRLADCRVRDYQPLPDLDAQRSGVVGIAVLTVQPSGWRRVDRAG